MASVINETINLYREIKTLTDETQKVIKTFKNASNLILGAKDALSGLFRKDKKQDSSNKEVEKDLKVVSNESVDQSKYLGKIASTEEKTLKTLQQQEKHLRNLLYFQKDQADDIKPVEVTEKTITAVPLKEDKKKNPFESIKNVISDFITKGAIGKSIAGALSPILKPIGSVLGKLGATLGLGKIGSVIGGLIGKGSKVAPNLLSKSSTALKGASTITKGMGVSSSLLKFGKLAGKAAVPITAALAAYDAYDSFMNPREIFDIDPTKKVSLQKKYIAGISGAIDSLTFGLADKKTIAPALDSFTNYVKSFFEFDDNDKKEKKSVAKQIKDNFVRNLLPKFTWDFFGTKSKKKDHEIQNDRYYRGSRKTSFKTRTIDQRRGVVGSAQKVDLPSSKGMTFSNVPADGNKNYFSNKWYAKVEGITSKKNAHRLRYYQPGKGMVTEKYKTAYGGIYDIPGSYNHKIIQKIDSGELSPVEGYKKIASKNVDAFMRKHSKYRNSKEITKQLIEVVAANAGGGGAARKNFIKAYDALDRGDVDTAIKEVYKDRHMTMNHKKAIKNELLRYKANMNSENQNDTMIANKVKEVNQQNQQTKMAQNQAINNDQTNRPSMVMSQTSNPSGQNGQINSIDNFDLEDDDSTIKAISLVG